MSNFAVGQRFGQHQVVQVEDLPHLQGTFVRLLHQPTGAQHIHIACPDDNQSFCVAFPTVPQDSTGIAHILEHIVLAGSEKYPVRDPFFSMIPRSLSTYMNASTMPDATLYPFSTRNTKDFYNLLSVYLDACFFPRIEYQAYRQEGWRYEFEQIDNPNSALKYGGVVFNEMKGAMAVPATLMFRTLGKAIFPNLTYANNSGGDPRHIPDLSWEALKAFHARHYHPSNAYFYTYGSLPLADILAAIGEHVLSRFGAIDPQTQIPNQPRFSASRTVQEPYAIAPNENPDKKAQVLLGFLTVSSEEEVERLGLEVLQRVLLSNAASPLRKALLESGIGQALADVTGYLTYFREAVFAFGLKGVNPQDAAAIEQLCTQVLQGLVRQGLDPQMVEAALHRLELESLEVSNAGFPYSLKLVYQMIRPYLDGADPLRAIKLEQSLAELRQRVQAGGYFEGLIQKHLLDNPHRVSITLYPDPQLNERLESAERSVLQQVQQNLSPQQAQTIVSEALALKARQETPEDSSMLPCLELTDVPKEIVDAAGEVQTHRGAQIGVFAQPTNGLFYLDLQWEISHLPASLKELLPAFAYALTRMGGGEHDYLQMAQRIEGYTGGITASLSLRHPPHSLEEHREWFSLSGKALYRNQEVFFSLLQDLMLAPKWDLAHLKNLLGQMVAQFEAKVVQMGHLMVLALAEAQLTPRGAQNEAWEGLSQLRTLKRLAALDSAGLQGLLSNFSQIAKHIFNSSGLWVCLTAEDAALPELQKGFMQRLSALPEANVAGSRVAAFKPQLQPQARATAVPVAYNAKVFRTVPFTHPDAPALLALAKLLRGEYLHREIRERGGAYGGFGVYRYEAGILAMLSYRDPHITRSFQVYDQALDAMLAISDAQKIKEAILGAAADIDPLLSPDSRGRVPFFALANGYTTALRQAFKARLLSLTAADLHRVAQTYLSQPAALAVLSNQSKIEQANLELPQPLAIEAI